MIPRNLSLGVWSTVVVFIGCAFLFLALSRNLVFFHTPSEVMRDSERFAHTFRLGGQIVPGSITSAQGVHRFSVIDIPATPYASATSAGAHTPLPVIYEGILPPLFAEGEEVIVEGRLESAHAGTQEGAHASSAYLLRAARVFSRHDERYRPVSATQARAP